MELSAPNLQWADIRQTTDSQFRLRDGAVRATFEFKNVLDHSDNWLVSIFVHHRTILFSAVTWPT